VYTLKLHPTLDVLVTGGRDGVARVWDMRTRSNVHVLSGHTGTVADLVCQEADPQVITGSLDSTVRMWDLAAGKTMGVLTHHKKGVRALATHPTEFTFATGSTGSIKQWKCPEGAFMQNFEGHNAIINTLAVNDKNIFFSGGDNGSMSFWDWKSGYRFQALDTTAQPGSLDAESGIMSSIFDMSGSRLICGEADKTSEFTVVIQFPGHDTDNEQSKSGRRTRMPRQNHIPSNGSRRCQGESFRQVQEAPACSCGYVLVLRRIDQMKLGRLYPPLPFMVYMGISTKSRREP
jgi:hypothetical protein